MLTQVTSLTGLAVSSALLAITNLSGLETVLVLVGVVAAAFFVLFSTRSRLAKSDLQASVIALQGEDTVNKNEIARLRERDVERERTIEALKGTVRSLERIVTGVDVIIEGFCLMAPEDERPAMRRKLERVRRDSEQAVGGGNGHTT